MDPKVICLIVGIVGIVAVILMAVMIPRTAEFKAKFIKKCKKFPMDSETCKDILASFEKTYVGKSPYNFPEKNYDPVFAVAPFKHPGAKTLLWSKTGNLAHAFSKNGNCFFTLEDTLLGSVLDGQTWCGLKGLKGTYTPFCKWCSNNTVDSFWRRASAKFAQHAMGTVTAMLDGDAGEPYSPKSFFRRIEIEQLYYPRVMTLYVILVTNKKGVCDNDPSIRELRETIRRKKIGYACTEVPSAHIQTCIENNKCESCWTPPFSGFETSKFILRTPYEMTVFYVFVYIIYSSIITN